MKIVVTGANGKIGREACKQLTEAGHKIVSLDITPGCTVVDCTDFGQTFAALSGVDVLGDKPEAVLHLAGIPMPGRAPDHITFANNTQSTYNVFSACNRLGINKIVWASSETLFGLPFTTPPDYVPLDEDHPLRPEWSYSLSKLMGEQMAEQFARWNPRLSIVSLRFSNVCDTTDYKILRENPDLVARRAANLWSYIDVRDAASACVLALQAQTNGHLPLIIAAADSVSATPTIKLLEEHYPNVPLKSSLESHQSLQSSAKAKQHIGFRPMHSWSDT